MRLELDPSEVNLLLGLIDSAGRERRNPPGTGSIRDREPRAMDRGRLEGIRVKLEDPGASEAHREQVVDHSIEETFPASDSPARSVVSESRIGSRRE